MKQAYTYAEAHVCLWVTLAWLHPRHFHRRLGQPITHHRHLGRFDIDFVEFRRAEVQRDAPKVFFQTVQLGRARDREAEEDRVHWSDIGVALGQWRLGSGVTLAPSLFDQCFVIFGVVLRRTYLQQLATQGPMQGAGDTWMMLCLAVASTAAPCDGQYCWTP